MESPLHILHLEDDPRNAVLVESMLETGGITCAVAFMQSRYGFVAARKHGRIDLILSDFSLPAFDGLSALGMARVHCPDAGSKGD
jgi:CheY-like chemotaxis protein